MIVKSRFEKQPLSYHTLGEARHYSDLLKLLMHTLDYGRDAFSNRCWILDLSNTCEPLFFNKVGIFNKVMTEQLAFRVNDFHRQHGVIGTLQAIAPIMTSSPVKQKEFIRKIAEKVQKESAQEDEVKVFQKILVKLARRSTKLFNILHRGVKFSDKAIIHNHIKQKHLVTYLHLLFAKFIDEQNTELNAPSRFVIYDPEGVIHKSKQLSMFLTLQLPILRKNHIAMGYYTCSLNDEITTNNKMFHYFYHMITTSRTTDGQVSRQPLLGKNHIAAYVRGDGERDSFELRPLAYYKDR